MNPKEIKIGSAKFFNFSWSIIVELKSQPDFLQV
jgi:hypothetical protein